MAIGLIGCAALAASTYTIIGTINGQSGVQTVNIRAINNDPANTANVRLYIAPSGYSSGPPGDAYLIDAKDLPILPLDVADETAIPAANGEKIVAFSNLANTTVFARGI